MEYYSGKKNVSLATCDNMDEPGGYYAKCNKSDRERHTEKDIFPSTQYSLYVES